MSLANVDVDTPITSEQRMTHLRQLGAEGIHIMREAAELFENPVLLYSIGKDSSVMLHLARKAFYPENHHSYSCTSTRRGSFER